MFPNGGGAREFAHKKLLQRHAIWWEPAYARTIVGDSERPLAPFFYRIHIVQITGHRAIPEHLRPPDPSPATRGSSRDRWLQRIMRQVRKQT